MKHVIAIAILVAMQGSAGSPEQSAEKGKYNDMFGAWSPDGQRIAFASDRSGDPEIYVANVSGRKLKRLTNAPGRDAHPSWSPDGRSIVFQSPREGGDVRIFRMDADGSNQRSLAPTKGFCGVPIWSPDGRNIAFQCSATLEKFGTPEAPWRIYLLEGDNAEPRAVTYGPGNDQVPAWSPDGRKLLFFSDRNGANQLYELELSSGVIAQLTNGPPTHSSASYAPDGKRIALMRGEGDAKPDVYVLSPPNSWVRITTSGPQFGTPAFSPDGKRLLMQMPTENGSRLFVAPGDGSGQHRMITFR